MTMEHLGIGGCSGLDGEATLLSLPDLCPGVKALNMHKLGSPTVGSLVEVLTCCRSIVSLDCHECTWNLQGESGRWGPCHRLENCLPVILQRASITMEEWLALGRSKFGETFHESAAIRTRQPIVRTG